MGKDTFDAGSSPSRLGTVVGNTIGQSDPVDRPEYSRTSDLCMHGGEPHLILVEPDQAYSQLTRGPFVKRWNGSSWVQLGGALETFATSIVTGSRYFPAWPQIRSDGADVYVAYVVREKDAVGARFHHHVVVQKWDGSSWSVLYDHDPHVTGETGAVMSLDFDVSDAAAGEWHVAYCKGNIQPGDPDSSSVNGLWYGAHDTAATRFLVTADLGTAGGVTHLVIAGEKFFLRCDSDTPFVFTMCDFALVVADGTKNHYYAIRMMNPRTATTVQTIEAPLWGGSSSLTSRRNGVGFPLGVSKKIARGGDDLYLLMLSAPAFGDPPYATDLDFIKYTEPKVVQVLIDGSAAPELLDSDPTSDQAYASPRWGVSVPDPNSPSGPGCFVQDDANENLYWVASYGPAFPASPARTAVFRDACPGLTPPKEWSRLAHVNAPFQLSGANTFPPAGDTGPLDGKDYTLPRPQLVGDWVYVNVYWPGVVGSVSGSPTDYHNAQHIVYRQRICRGCDLCIGGGLHIWDRAD